MEIHQRKILEVCSKEDGFFGSYYEVELLGRAGRDELLVEFLTLVAEGDENVKLREVVPARNLRPRPPHKWVTEFDVMEKVDAYDRDGWWVGRVTGKLPGEDMYLVHFDSTGDELGYPGYLLRAHQEWENGTWVPSHGRRH